MRSGFLCVIFQSVATDDHRKSVSQMKLSQSQEERLIESSFLFHFSVPCHQVKAHWKKNGLLLPDQYILPCFDQLDALPAKEKKSWAEVRLGWNMDGLILNLSVTGKAQDPWCRDSRIEDSDGIAIWLNTRSTSSIHRASRFCHEFRFLPFGAGPQMKQPIAQQCEIKRAKENAKIASGFPPEVRSRSNGKGYTLQAFVPGKAVSGFDPEEHPQIGFHFVVSDRELGTRSMTLSDGFPTDADPSLWSTLELIGG